MTQIMVTWPKSAGPGLSKPNLRHVVNKIHKPWQGEVDNRPPQTDSINTK